MPIVQRRRWLQLVGLIAGVIVLTPASARLVAQTSSLLIESSTYDLKSPDPIRRETAARVLGLAHHKAVIPQLIAMSTDPVASVRREVELSLERMEDERTLAGFIAFASDNEADIRSRAVASLINLHLPHAVGVGAALTSLRERLVFGADRDLDLVVEPDVPVDPAVIETLRGRLRDDDRGIRRLAARGLGILRAKPAVPDLLQVVQEDRDDGMRFEALRALRKIDDVSVGGQLVLLLNINADSVRNELIATLGAMRYRGAVPELTRIVDQGKRNDEASMRALAALADIADPSSVPLFERFRADDNEQLRLSANEGIARAAADSNAKTQMSAARLVEKSARVRTAQAFALLRTGEKEYLDELVRALDHLATRDLAKEYLLETPPTDRAALFAPRQANATTRAELADVFGRMGDPDALVRLQEMERDSNRNVARAADRAARRIAVVSVGQ